MAAIYLISRPSLFYLALLVAVVHRHALRAYLPRGGWPSCPRPIQGRISPSRGSRLADVTGNRKFVDSPLEGTGFELLAGCGKSRDFGKTVMKRARNGNLGLIKSTGYEGAKGDELGWKHHRPTFSAAC